jgi:hypothetical protein
MRWWMVAAVAAGCGGNDDSTTGTVLEAMDGLWTGSAKAMTLDTFPFSADFTYDESLTPALSGRVDLESYLFDVQEATSDTEYADLVMYNPQGRARLELSGVAVDGDALSGHFDLDLCWATDPGQDTPYCHAEGNFAATR